ncbi:hypothetical protein GGI25_004728 [Coemansia spiralis]|uniref:Alpha/beta hydrolase fold-3 domain-containing protein n=2 Tax=Coemansia TaxID=4863 RepID=A0A9W8KWS7_9FUNG|nr:alpha/beta hydrolase fold-domain-containing protein [Coemansia spiralis]KAJ1989700.1 hypothetical protein EDC05_004498 [Coemansia umbellata]KAJ2620509.1 hypothetical protein GGI26_004916 [Coemansia sp. RSA 1358]KAJ2673393.1 hypothetical protein GGI25_004728 [Coemansia spiralis]
MLAELFQAAKTIISIAVYGKRRPSWDWKLHMFCDIVRNYTKQLFPEFLDENIESLDYKEVHRKFAASPIPSSKMGIDIGVYIALGINVADIQIDASKLSGFGLAEEPLKRLINLDLSDCSTGRLLPFELLAAWTSCEHHDEVSRVDYSKALDPYPLSAEEKVILYLHGGSYVQGSPDSHRELVAQLSKCTKMRAFVVDYRLAPLDPFPAQLHDALILYNYLLKLGYKPSSIIFAGDSAGGHICLDLFLLLRHGYLQGDNIAGMVLMSPMPAFGLKGDSLKTNEAFDYLVPIPLEWPTSPIRLAYKPGHRCTDEYKQELDDPILTPANGCLAGLPPIIIQCGECELIVDDIRRLHEKIKGDDPAAESKIIYEEYKDMFHVFHRFLDRPESKQAFESLAKFADRLN